MPMLLQKLWADGQQSSEHRSIWSFLTTTVWQWAVCRLQTIRQESRFSDMMQTLMLSKLSVQENSQEQFLRTLMLRQLQHSRFSATFSTDSPVPMSIQKAFQNPISTATRFLPTSYTKKIQKLCSHRTLV